MNLGYACINMELNARKGDDRVTTNRTMIKRTFQEKGVDYTSELVLQNVSDLYQIIEWNEQNNIKFFRTSSEIFPWASEYNLKKLPDYNLIKNILDVAGALANKYGQRITSHPGPFNVLTSPHPHVVENCINDLSIHGEVFDMMGRLVKNIHTGILVPGNYTFSWNGRLNNSSQASSGTYFLVVSNDASSSVNKMLLLK